VEINTTANGNDEHLTRRDEILLAEYQKAQDSAEHHDKLLWSVVGLILSGMTGLVAFAVTRPEAQLSFLVRLLLPFLGVAFAILLMLFVRSFAAIRNFKYERCKGIEKELVMEQHLKLQLQAPGQRHVVYVVGWTYLGSCVIWAAIEICRHYGH
jgi:hypothetical protein